ncbi:MAG: hypothetical protein GY859_28350 [Desulfobacterales bacterium]|nr:hypothetical protein [Desulfobacterales bacterium]
MTTASALFSITSNIFDFISISDQTMINYPPTTARVENTSAAYVPSDWLITLERQRPAVAEFTIDQPIETADTALFSLGLDGNLVPCCALRILECDQIAADAFECLAVDPLRAMLDAPYFYQGTRVTLDEVLKSLAGSYNLSYANHTGKVPIEKQNPVLISTVRNALDQIADIYKTDTARWHIDFAKGVMALLPGKIPAPAVELPLNLFIEENLDRGPEFNVLPQMRPFTPLRWRDRDKTVDRVIFDSKTDSMFLKLAA